MCQTGVQESDTYLGALLCITEKANQHSGMSDSCNFSGTVHQTAMSDESILGDGRLHNANQLPLPKFQHLSSATGMCHALHVSKPSHLVLLA